MATYNPDYVKAQYAAQVEGEWARLDGTPRGKLMYQAHLQALRWHIRSADAVLEVGAGPGRFTKDLATLAGELVVTDLTPENLVFNRAKMTELGLADRIADWREADICDLSAFPDARFDVVVCIGGPFNYVFESEDTAFSEMLRVLRPGGLLILGLMCLPGIVRSLFHLARAEFETVSLDAIRWILETGKQDRIHYTVPSQHISHFMTRNDVLALCDRHGAQLVAEYSGGVLATVPAEHLDWTYANPPLWELLVEAELRWCASPGSAESGDHMISVVQRA